MAVWMWLGLLEANGGQGVVDAGGVLSRKQAICMHSVKFDVRKVVLRPFLRRRACAALRCVRRRCAVLLWLRAALRAPLLLRPCCLSTLPTSCSVLTLLLVLADAQFVEGAEQLKRLRLAS